MHKNIINIYIKSIAIKIDYGLAIDRCNEPSSYYNSRGTCWHELGKYTKALNDYNFAINCNNKCVSAYNNRASLYVDMGAYKLALKDADIGLNIYSNHGNLYKHRGLAYFYLKDYKNSLDDIQKSIKFAPKYRPARITLKLLWDFYYKNIINVIVYEMDIGFNCDLCIVLVDYIVGNNYQTNDNMVDATYADWKKEMALMEEEKRKNQQQQQEQEQEQQEQQEEE